MESEVTVTAENGGSALLLIRDIYYRNLKLIDWRLAPPLERNFRLEFEQPDIAAFEKLCAKWGLSEISESWRGFSVPRETGLSAVIAIRMVLEAGSCGSVDRAGAGGGL